MDKFEIIKNFLLDESVSPEIRRERFNIAWDIRNHLDEVKKSLRQKVFEKVVEKLRNSEVFKDYEKVDKGFLEGKTNGTLWIFKKSWMKGNNIFISYTINCEGKEFFDVNYGIVNEIIG